jgi:hypothetical protein
MGANGAAATATRVIVVCSAKPSQNKSTEAPFKRQETISPEKLRFQTDATIQPHNDDDDEEEQRGRRPYRSRQPLSTFFFSIDERAAPRRSDDPCYTRKS